MTALVNEHSTLTDRYQTTIPSGVRKQLNLAKGDRIRYCTEANGRVYIEPDTNREQDPALEAFLVFLENDIKAHPDRLVAYGGALHSRLESLVGDIDVDLDAPLLPEDE